MEVEKLDHAYISKETAELASDAHKVGKAVDKNRRESQLNAGSAQGSRIIYDVPTCNAKIVEDMVKVSMRRSWPPSCPTACVQSQEAMAGNHMP